MSIKISELPESETTSTDDYLVVDDGVSTSKIRASKVGSTALDAYPVGALYLSVINTSPATLFGGTWQQITTDAYLKIVTSDGGSAGGTASNHKIPLTSIPAHTHTVTDAYSTNGEMGWNPSSYIYKNVESASTTRTTSSAGGGEAYYPYYIGVYVWKRTA